MDVVLGACSLADRVGHTKVEPTEADQHHVTGRDGAAGVRIVPQIEQDVSQRKTPAHGRCRVRRGKPVAKIF